MNILIIDQGTTSTRSIIYNENADIVALSQRELSIIKDKSNHVEMDANEIWQSVKITISDVVKKANINYQDISGIGLTNQRETSIIWDKKTGKPLHNAVVWQSLQSLDICKRYESEAQDILYKTGLKIDPYFSATKYRWLLENVEHDDNYLLGTVDTYILYMLTGGKSYFTDVTNASRTMLYNINTLDWDKKLLSIFNIDKNKLPIVKDTIDDFGYTCDELFDNANIPIYSLVGDQQSALFGQRCFDTGSGKVTYGTGCFILYNIGKEVKITEKSLFTSIAWKIGDDISYCIEGSIFVGGNLIKWLKDDLQIIDNVSDTSDIAMKAEEKEGFYIIPTFQGVKIPIVNTDIKGTIVGMDFTIKREDIIKASLDSLAYLVTDNIKEIENEIGIVIKDIKVDGGVTNNEYLMQRQADITRNNLIKQDNSEATSLGCYYLTAIKCGLYKDIKDIACLPKKEKVYIPVLEEEKAHKLYFSWKKISLQYYIINNVKKIKKWFQNI